MTPSTSIVIPALGEGRRLAAALARLPAAAGREIVVCAASASDAATAERAGVRVVAAPPNRAAQLQAGARAAAGSVLLFLHADTRLPAGGLDAVGRALADPRVVGGAFRLAIDSPRALLRLVAWGANLRSRALRRPYGDQALFVRRDVFQRAGGFRALDIMEDADLVRRIRRQGRLVILPDVATTSSRRWDANGVVRTTLVNRAAAMLFGLGVSPRRIRRLYDSLLADGRG